MLQKIFTIFSIILMSVNSAYLQHSKNAINFSDYNKQYSDDELISRFTIFKDNINKIEKHNR